MMNDTTTTEQLKDTAKSVFFKQGRFSATTADIADAAGVNRILAGFYFRSAAELLKKVCAETQQTVENKMDSIFRQQAPGEVKVEEFVAAFFEDLAAYPYQPAHLALQMPGYHISDHKTGVCARAKILTLVSDHRNIPSEKNR